MRLSTLTRSTILGSLTLVLAVPALAADNLSPQSVLNMSLQDLTNLEVTSVSKKAEKANEAAAAIFVITQEDIKRSGATNIPDVLRMAPGIDVAQAGAHDWAVTARGFNNQFANKLLVLIDGRTVYNPLFSGVFWQMQDTLLEDIDRIEVIRGPGATQWGANAVNGVINIITKNAKDTEGGLASASAGNLVRTQNGIRYGIKTGNDSYARVYAKYDDDAPEFNVGPGRSGDGWHKDQAGFRSDSKLSNQDSLTFQGDAYKSTESERHVYPQLTAPFSFVNPDNIDGSGANILARWTRNISPVSSTSTQFYLDNAQYKAPYLSYNATTADFDFQHTWTGWDRNEIVWGVGYRLIEDHNGATFLSSLTPAERSMNLYSAFLQDKFTLHPDDLFLTLGSKVENNAFTGYEIQPSARLSWLISNTQMAWSSVSRAVHTPGRSTSDTQFILADLPPGVIFGPGPTQVTVVGNPNLNSEELIAYELGYRIQPTKSISLDLATFYNDYSKIFLAQTGAGTVLAGPVLFLPESAQNINSAYSDGFELSTKIDATQNWQLSGSFSYLNLHIANPAVNVEFTAIGTQPKDTFNIRSTYLFPHGIEMTNSLYYVNGFAVGDISGYYRFDTKLSYEIMKNMEVSLVGQNLLQPQHKEFESFLYQSPVEVGRSVYANMTFKF